jgi:Carbonic anhydrase
MNRRQSLVFISAAAAATLTRAQASDSAKPALTATPPVSAAAKLYRERIDTATPQSMLDWLKAGNERFRTGRSTQGGQANDARARLAITAQGQRGLAVVVSCIDSRVSPELLLDAGIGDLYTVRLGANVIGEDALGCVEVAVASDAKVVLLLGHTRCAGVRAACANVELEHFTQLLNKVRPPLAGPTRRWMRTNRKPPISASVPPPIHAMSPSCRITMRAGKRNKFLREVKPYVTP